MSDLKIKLIAEIDESSISNMTKQLKGIQEGVGKIKIDIDTNEVMSRLTQLESKMKPMDLKIDTSKASAAASGLVTTYDKAGRNIDKVSVSTTKLAGETQDVIKRITDSTTASGQLLKSTQSINTATGEVSKQVDRVTSNYKKQRSEVEKLSKAQSKSLWGQSKDILDNRVKVPDGLKEMNKYYKDLEKSSTQASKTVERTNKQISKSLWGQSKDILDNRVKQSDELKKMGAYYKELERSTGQATTATKSFGETMGDALKRAVGWVSLTLVIRRTWRAIKEGVEIVKEIDTSMVELSKVTNETEEAYSSFAKSSFGIGRELGRTGKEVIDATANFARMGFDLKQSAGLAQEALLMLNVGDGIESVDEATKAMIATLKGFQTPAEDAAVQARVINDAYNEVANNFAVSTGNIAEGVRKISALMSSSGNDMNETIGMFTGIFEVVQDDKRASTALRMISQRLRGITDEGEDSVQLVAKLREEFKSVADIDLQDSNGQLKSTYQILEEMSVVYPTLTKNQQAYLGELAAGKRYTTELNALMTNWENVAAATETARYSAGSAMIENEKYLDSIEGKMGILKSTTQDFWSTAINTDSIKNLVDAGTQFVKVATGIVDSMGGIESIAMLVVPLIGIKFFGALKNASISGDGFAESLKGIGKRMTGITGSFTAFNLGMLGVQAALVAIPALIMSIKVAEEKRKVAIEDSLSAFEKQKEMTGVLSELIIIYGDLSEKTERTKSETELLASVKERIATLSPEVASAMDDETLSIDEQVKSMNNLAKEQEEIARLKALEIIASSDSKEELEKELKFLEDAYNKKKKIVEDYVKEKNEAILNGEEFEENHIIEAYSKNLPDNLDAMQSIKNEIQSIEEATNLLNGTNKNTSGGVSTLTDQFGNLTDEIGNVVDEQGDYVKSAREAAEEGMPLLIEALSEAAFESDEYAESLQRVIDLNHELNGTGKESELEGRGIFIDDITKKYQESEKHVDYLIKAEEELAENGKISFDTQSKLGKVNLELVDIRGLDKEEALKVLEVEKKIHKEKMTNLDEQITASAKGESIYDAQREAILRVNSDIAQGIKDAVTEVEDGTSSIQDIWKGIDADTKEFIIDITGFDEEDENFYKELEEWFRTDPEPKEFVIISEGLNFIQDRVEELGINWENLDSEEKVLTASVIGNAIQDVPDFIEKWDGLSEDERQFFINVLLEGTDDYENFQNDWENLDPKVQEFIAEAVGIKDVENADAEMREKWSKDPRVLMYVAKEDGLGNIVIEKDKTDGIWNEPNAITYRTNEEGAIPARTNIRNFLDVWNPIPTSQSKTTTMKHKTVYETLFPTNYGLPVVPRWTGDDDFQGGLSFVGEKGRELLIYPDGTHDMTGQKAELRNLPRGTIIYNNQDTEDILAGKKKPEFSRSDKRVMGGSNTPGFHKGNKEAEKVTGSKTHGFASGNAKAEDRAIADIYERVNRQLEKQGNLIKRNNLLQESAGDDLAKKIVLLKEEIELNEKQMYYLRGKQTLQRKEKADLERHLKAAGFKFTGKGDDRAISNLGNIKGKNSSVEEKFNKYNDLTFNLIPNVMIDEMEIKNKIASAVSKGFEQATRITNNITENDHLLEMNRINQDRETGDVNKRILLMKEEIKLLERKAYLGRGQQTLIRKEREELEKTLRVQGLKFTGSGDDRRVSNPNKIKGQVKEVEEALARYNEIQFDLIPKLVLDGMKFADEKQKVKDAIAIDLAFEVSDAEVDRLNKKAARSLENNKIVQRKNDPHWDIVSNQSALEATEEKSLYQYNKGWEYLNLAKKYDEDSENFKKLNDKAQGYFKDSRDSELEIFDLKTKVHEGQMRYIDDEVDANRKAQDELKFQMELLADDDLAGKLDLTSKIAAKEIESYTTIKSNVKALEDQLRVTLWNTDEWHVINDSLEKYNQLLKDSTLELKKQKDELVKIAQAQADKQFDADLSTAEKSIFGGQTEKDAKKILDDKIEAFEDYISGEEKALEIAQIRKMVEEEGLTLTREQQDLLNQGGQVERDKLDRLNKQLNIQQLQAKLENQKNQKNIRQLVKKDDGTFDFEYVADKKAIKETENALLDSKKDLANWELKNSLDKDKKIFEEKQKLLAVEEERLQARLKAEKEAIELHYQAIMERQIAMMEMNMVLMEQLNSEKSIDGWAKTLEGVMPLMDELGINFAELMEELGIDLTDNFDIILPLLYDMGLLHEDMVDGMGVDFEKYMDAVIPVLDELGIDHEEFLTFMGVDLDAFLLDAGMTFAEYSETVRKKNAETKADVDRTKEALRVPTESTHTVKLIAPPPFSMPDSSSTHTVHTVYTSSGGSSSDKGMAKFDTGGKTPAFSGGRIAMLHEKEIVLNKSQSATFEKLIDIMPNMINTFNDIAGKFKGVAPKIPKVPTATNNSHSEETVQHFNINKLEFPNVKSADEIEKAILKLPMLAKQRVRPV